MLCTAGDPSRSQLRRVDQPTVGHGDRAKSDTASGTASGCSCSTWPPSLDAGPAARRHAHGGDRADGDGDLAAIVAASLGDAQPPRAVVDFGPLCGEAALRHNTQLGDSRGQSESAGQRSGVVGVVRRPKADMTTVPPGTSALRRLAGAKDRLARRRCTHERRLPPSTDLTCRCRRYDTRGSLRRGQRVFDGGSCDHEQLRSFRVDHKPASGTPVPPRLVLAPSMRRRTRLGTGTMLQALCGHDSSPLFAGV